MLFLTPLVINIGIKYNLYDFIDTRKEKKIPTVRIGGMAITFGFISSIIFLDKFFYDQILHQSDFNYLNLIVIIGIFFSILGLLDDLFNISAIKRLIIQIFSGLIISFVFFNIKTISLYFMNIDLLDFNIPYIASVLITILWLVGITNAFNWLDGLDGLLIGLSVIYSTAFLIVSFNSQNIFPFIHSSALLGASIGFLKYNRYPAKIFMGDSGSYFVGINMASLAIMSCNNNISFENQFTNIIGIEISSFFPLMIFLLPIFDMIFVIVKRINDNKSIFYPDRNHLHHRILKLGLNERKVVHKIYHFALITTIFSFTNIKNLEVISFFLTLSLVYFFILRNKENQKLFMSIVILNKV